MAARKGTPKAVVEQIKIDLAESERGKQGIIPAIASKWGVTEEIVTEVMRNREHRKDIMALREASAERALMLTTRLDERIVECLEDDKKMKETSFRDMTTGRDKLVASAITAIEGHVPQVQNFNFALIKEAKASVEAYDERRKARLAELKTIDVQPA